MDRPSMPGVPPNSKGIVARCAVARCREAGIDPEPMLHRAKLSTREIGDRHAHLGVGNQVSFLNLVADALRDDLLGFHLAQSFDLREAGLFYFVLASSATLGEVLERASRYSTIGNEGLRLEFLTSEEVGIRFSCVAIPRHTDRHLMEFWATALVRMTRHLTGTRLAPVRASLVHPPCSISGEMEAFFGCSVAFSSDDDEVVYGKALEGYPLVETDFYLNELLVGYCEDALAHRPRRVAELRTRIENAITPLLPHGTAHAANVATELGMGVRTMSRRLAAENLTFFGILDALRADLAQRYLKEPSLTISQIAWLLGFREVSAFTHAFKRRTGRSPTQVRSSGIAAD
jgi:AraC-like DNA-binding protein